MSAAGLLDACWRSSHSRSDRIRHSHSHSQDSPFRARRAPSRSVRSTTGSRATSKAKLERERLKFAADQIDYYTDTRRLIATGHVVVITPDSHISADKADLDTRNRKGIFYNAFGTVSVASDGASPEGASQSALFGGQEPIAYFYGETIERTGPDTYKITRGGFTTCVQPTPRWEAVTSTATMRVDRYAVLKNAVLKVKNVPLFYLPVMYYPIQRDDRATGFLMPIYGNSRYAANR